MINDWLMSGKGSPQCHRGTGFAGPRVAPPGRRQPQAASGGSMSPAGAEMFAFTQLVDRAAIRALGGAALGDVQVHARMGVPELHVRLRAGAEDAAVGVQVLGDQFDDRFFSRGGAHGPQTRVSQWAYLGLRPFTMSKNAACSFSVIGPRRPMPISTRSSSRMGVTSAAVPVKKHSSAM